MDRSNGKDHIADDENMASLIRKFAAAKYFRSATIDELELDGDFCRRPLRPEDLEFMDFTVPVAADTICDLPSLAAQRILRCIYDMQIAKLPRMGDRRALERCAEFYSDANRIVAARIAPSLERFAFGFLEQLCPQDRTSSRSQLCENFETIVRDANAFARVTRTRFLQGSFSEAALRFILVQKWCLGAAKRVAIARAQTSGYFDLLPWPDWPRNGSGHEENDALTHLAIANDVNREPNAFWQFYLPTSLAQTNHVSALAARPERSLALIGATFVAESEWQSFAWIARQACEDMGIVERDRQRLSDFDRALADTTARFARALSAVEKAFDADGLDEVYHGVDAAARLAQLARLDLEKQLRWLASIDDYAEIARRVDHRIHTQRPDIDRETFVEPREMCSTTHVHDDHRLVVIESGDMVFWGRPGMRFRMAPGDMVLVPRGRLHGSSVESEQCIYHQPIIPEDWVRPLVDEVDQRHGWPIQ